MSLLVNGVNKLNDQRGAERSDFSRCFRIDLEFLYNRDIKPRSRSSVFNAISSEFVSRVRNIRGELFWVDVSLKKISSASNILLAGGPWDAFVSQSRYHSLVNTLAPLTSSRICSRVARFLL